MVTVGQLQTAKPDLWHAAATAWQNLVNRAHETSDDIRDRGVGEINEHWTDEVGQRASATFASAADGFDIAADTIDGIVMVLDGLADAISMAQTTLEEALREAGELDLSVADDGQVRVTEDGLAGALGNARLQNVRSLISDALTAATKADQDAADELRKLAAAVNVTDVDQAENQVQGAASQDQLAILADMIPANATPEQVSAWWNSLTPQQRTELENAVPLQIYSLEGIPQDVKDQLRGSGDINRMTLVQFATDHWNDGAIDWPGLDNCTNFASTALNVAGMKQSDAWHTPELDGPLLIDAPDLINIPLTRAIQKAGVGTATHSWGAAQNLHDLLVSGGGKVVQPSQAKPGDIMFLQWQDSSNGHQTGEVHHTAIVTAVLPNGDIRYTQHTDPGLEYSVNGRVHDVTAGEGASQWVFVQPSPNGY